MQGLFAGGKPFERYQNLLTCRETSTKTVYIQSEEEVGLGWAMKDKVSLSIFPIPHVKDYPSIPPQCGYCSGGWSELLGLKYFPGTLFGGGGEAVGEATATRSISCIVFQ
jgi:hypothetical protein